jgi:hypothetical protein
VLARGLDGSRRLAHRRDTGRDIGRDIGRDTDRDTDRDTGRDTDPGEPALIA